MVDTLLEFLNEHALTILDIIITAIVAVIGAGIKKVYSKYINDKTKAEVVKTCVTAVEQIYVDLHGAEKFGECLRSASEILEEKGIKVSELELRMLIESAVKSMNKELSDVFDGLPNAGVPIPDKAESEELIEDEDETAEDVDEEIKVDEEM